MLVGSGKTEACKIKQKHLAWGDLLTSYDGKTITYDAIGNPLTYGNQMFTWQHGRQLATLNDGTTTWIYTYDANGMRKSRSNGATTYTYTYNGSQLTQMTKGTDTLYFTYDAFGAPWTVKWNGTVYNYMTNLQGDVIAIVNTSNVAVVEYVYDAWGNVLSISGTMATTLGTLNPLRYRGYVYDYETGLYYLQSRYYNPEWGRFLNADGLVSTGQGLLGNNMFVYCNNNPVMFTDSTGTRVDIWPVLFGDHNPGYIHRQVQLHIIASGIVKKELYLPGVGCADI